MVDVSKYLGQEISDLDISDFLNVKLPSVQKVDDYQEIGIAGFTAMVIVNEKKEISSEAPDITLEDGRTVQDTVFIKPLIITLEGNVAQVTIKDSEADSVFQTAEKITGIIDTFSPGLTTSQSTLINELEASTANTLSAINSAVAQGKSLLEYFGVSSSKDPQEQFLDYIEKLIYSKMLIKVETAYRVYDNMVINSIETNRTAESKALNFKIICKQLRFASSESSDSTANASTGLSGQAESTTTDKGTTSGTTVEDSDQESILSAGINAFSNLFD